MYLKRSLVVSSQLHNNTIFISYLVFFIKKVLKFHKACFLLLLLYLFNFFLELPVYLHCEASVTQT